MLHHVNNSFIDEDRLADICRFVEAHQSDIIRDIARLVSIPSVEGPAAPGAPFGTESRRALDCALQIASELGLEAVNCEDRLGYAFVGEDRGQGYLATITHVDVVPAGEGWSSDPFTLREREGYLLGRGVMDDKGPSVLCLYALKYLKDAGIPLRYPVRALLGSNEETGMLDVEHYIAHYPAPLFCFSPDADFPLIHGEKGIYHARLVSKHTPVNVLELSGGVAANAVPAKAEARVRAASLAGTDAVSVEELEPGLWKLSAAGISGHASMPEGTVLTYRCPALDAFRYKVVGAPDPKAGKDPHSLPLFWMIAVDGQGQMSEEPEAAATSVSFVEEGVNGLEGFDAIRDDPRFGKAAARAKKLFEA